MEESPKKRSRPPAPQRSRGLSNGSIGSIGGGGGRDRSNSLLIERDAQIAALEQEVTLLQNKLSTLTREYHSRPSVGGAGGRRRHHALSPYGHHVHENTSKCGARRKQLTNLRARMGRNASVATAAVLNALPDDDHTGGAAADGSSGSGGGALSSSQNGGKPSSSIANIIHRITEMFKDPASHMTYLNSPKFAKDLLKLNSRVRPLLEAEPRVAFLQSPAYVFGDIHGNLEDLHFFSDNIWRLGMALTAGNFIFLGDYVDRGMSCLECVAYLFVMKLTLPHKVYLLRGNHETRDVNGWEEHYGIRSFLWQCRDRFGDELGYRVWEATNQTFDRMPLSAVIDQDIFCVHGGIPRPITDGISDVEEEEEDDDDDDDDESSAGGLGRKGSISNSIKGTRIQDILTVPNVAGINPPFEHEDEDHQQVASDCIWSDPASEEQERTGVDPATGFGDSLRGGGAICFGHRAVTDFLQQQGLSYIMRAHEAHAEGVAVSKGARVFTVFSTSKDHNQGSQAMAGCILVDFEKMQVINRSPAYRNQYVHRRDSVSIARLSEGEIEKRMKLGLVTAELGADAEGEEEEYEEGHYVEEEQWEDLVEDDIETDDNEEDVEQEGSRRDSEDSTAYGSFRGRKSSVDPTETHASPIGGSHDNHVWGEFDGRERSDSNSTAGSAGSGTLDFSNVEISERKSKRAPLGGFSAIQEEDEEEYEEEEDGEEEESTVDGRGSQEADEHDMDVSSSLGGGSITMSRGGSGGGRRAKASF